MSHISRQESYLAAYVEYSKQNAENKGVTGTGQATGKNKLTDALNNAESYQNVKFHSDPLDTFLSEMGVNDLSSGISSYEATTRLQLHGPNKLSERSGTPWYIMFVKQLTGFFALLLWVGATLCIIAYSLNSEDPSNLYLGIVLATVVFLTGCFSFYQEAKSAAIMAKFKDMAPPKCTVLRDGDSMLIEAADVVPGDVILIHEGDKIPADMRVVESDGLKIDQASLTGESDLVKKNIEPSMKKPVEADNLVFFGTLVKGGAGKGVVYYTGDRTFIGSIAHLAAAAETEQTPINKEIHHFIKIISGVAFVLGTTFFIVGLLYGYEPITNLVFAIGIIVANVPEGLLATVTVSLTLTAKRMASKNVLVKNLESVETLGSTTCICSDKTGTLTMNVMTVASVVYNGEIFPAPNLGQCRDEHTEDKVAYNIKDEAFTMLMKCGLLNNTACFNYMPLDNDYDSEYVKATSNMNEEEKRVYKERFDRDYAEKKQEDPVYLQRTAGNASEGALLKFFQPIRGRKELQKAHIQLASIPFNSTNKYALTIHAPSKENHIDSHGEHLLLLKGAPEIIFRMSKYYLRSGNLERIDESHKAEFEDLNNQLGKQGQRVLGFAYRYLSSSRYPEGFDFVVESDNENFPLKDFIFVGMVGLQDPPRPGVPEAVLKCQSAGIKVVMVTGDQQVTATAIARQVNIITAKKTVNDYMDAENNQLLQKYGQKAKLRELEDFIDESDSIIIHGDLLAAAYQNDLLLPENERGKKLDLWLSKKELVFSRTTPAQKLIIVEGCQRQRHIVAVTGDGVNDSPAIKKADIGIAMNIVGSDVAKDAADMLLMDDNFASIVKGVEEGRLIFDNLKKSIAYTLSSNIPEIGPFLSFIVFQLPLPLSTVLILCVDLGTDMIPAISLAYENAELDIMRRKPRNSDQDHLVNLKLISFSYLQIGVMQCLAGFYTYFVVMNDYGFPPSMLFFFALNEDGKEPGVQDDPDDLVDWIGNDHDTIDLREWYKGTKYDGDFSKCRYDTKSNVSDHEVCFTTEALKYAQTAYFVSIVVVQWADIMICKTRKLSIAQQGMKNKMLFLGLASETLLAVLLCYIPFLNVGLGTRALEFLHFGVPALPYFIIIFTYDEIRKLLMRSWYECRPKAAARGEISWIEKHTYY